MIEKVNPSHPDKVADRIAGAIVDYAYTQEENPKVAVEVLIGHGECNIIVETDIELPKKAVKSIVLRIAGNLKLNLKVVKQDKHLANNQNDKIRCGDNGIFKGMPLTQEEKIISKIARYIYNKYGCDGKYILNNNYKTDGTIDINSKLIICQSNSQTKDLKIDFPDAIINPLGDWTGGLDVDSGATNRKLGSDMAQSVTGGGLHGKDLSKADVSVNIYAFLKAQETRKPIELFCAIGDESVDGKPYNEIVKEARQYIYNLGGFEKFAEWGFF